MIALDLPGFGAPDMDRADMVAALADGARAQIAERVTGSWVLLGHSMGGKVAGYLAAQTLSGQLGLFGLLGVVLLAPSPPTPEPMAESRRSTMLQWAAHGPISAGDAQEFIDQNVAGPLADADRQRVRDSVTQCSPAAWRRWLTTGSNQDVSAQVGTLDVPALIFGGDQDDDLGASAQPGLHAGTYPRASYVPVPDCGHLIALEQPAFVAERIDQFVRDELLSAPLVPSDWCALLASERTIPAVRRSLAHRAIPDDPSYAPKVLSAQQLSTLRHLADVVLPQDAPAIDVAARVDAQLEAGEGDGWRPEGLPPDPQAYRTALSLLATATVDKRMVGELIAGESSCGDDTFGPGQLRAWFEDARVDLTRQWLGHPAIMARTGFDGFAAGSLATPQPGYDLLGPGERDAWEPADLGSVPAS